MELSISIAAFNTSKLDGELKAALPGVYQNLSTIAQGQPIIVRLIDAATPGNITTAQNTCTAHDPTPVPDPLVAAVTQAKTDQGVNALDNLTVAQMITYINTNVTDLPSAKAALVLAAKIIGVHERRMRLIESKLGL